MYILGNSQELVTQSHKLSAVGLKASTTFAFRCGVFAKGRFKGWFAFPCFDRENNYYLGALSLPDRQKIFLPPEIPRNEFIFPFFKRDGLSEVAVCVRDPLEVLLRHQADPKTVYFTKLCD